MARGGVGGGEGGRRMGQKEERQPNWARLRPWVVVFEEDVSPKAAEWSLMGVLQVIGKMAFKS